MTSTQDQIAVLKQRSAGMTNQEIAYLAGVVVVEFVAIAALVILIGAGA